LLISERRRSLARQLAEALDVKGPIRLVARGGMGHDSTYFVRSNAKTIGVLRLLNPHKQRPLPKADQPFAIADGCVRLEREWSAYERASSHLLAPRPLWRCEDAVLCEFVPKASMLEHITRQPAKAWLFLKLATNAIGSLHAVGLTHMDASLTNILSDDDGQHPVFIDFEYTPGPGLSLAGQRAYDHLRILESTWKYLEPQQQRDYPDWVANLAAVAGDKIEGADLAMLRPALGRILSHPPLAAQLAKLFSRPAIAA
jgi:hypothetical protein